MKQFRWNRKKDLAAQALADGYTEEQSAEIAGVSRSSIARWKQNLEFITEVDKLSCMIGIASRAERLRIAKKIIREKITSDYRITSKDLLEWMKYAQSETDGIKLGIADTLAELFAAIGKDDPSVSGSGPAGNNQEDHSNE